MSEAKKSARRLAREVALQGLYEWRMSGNSLPMIEDHLAQECEAWGRADRPLALVLLRGASGNADTLEAALSGCLDRPAEELSPVERAILLLGAYELTHRIETPYRVVINEAIELAKDFGGTDGHRYINGVLDKFAPQVRAAEVEHAAKQRKTRD
ncbi:MAG: N utilization substance protein B [Candidatus Dactylopiibacterium carminicum]|uniref:Transcription antitermination protein NusB n=1 Tax=Candidatus Dactylopiibacterium carminicum TaxID=857335 RepID=A0A272EYY7_9RHOO|nr:transcription antitermination factor NusB [Candidatus Dactylopiibacterium carminicum]KAF7600796.1 transcription antitermination factor NusB [Candidatus Dactylopiibacterium carminicum]PAS95295.1 MAG: N utilization substance protein B [Candidatus Dactylopiibacterium carminicum]PAS98693.1 MAG: N utilization substance protein B [Candidatus Dactylopiibacterium carminicum]PAT00803.1 MAG: N utilization substance protein B [Candidatus Dactylopiibacterium carminicum]